MKRTVSGIILMLLLTSMLTSAVHIQPVKASGDIYIRADGSIDPPTAPISTFDDIAYNFTGDINNSLVVQRSSIVIDGAGHTLQGYGSGSGTGINLTSINNVTIRNTNIIDFDLGICIISSSGNTVLANNITGNSGGIEVARSASNTVAGNTLSRNGYGGIFFHMYSYGNSVLDNNVSENGQSGIGFTSSYNNVVSDNNVSGRQDTMIKAWKNVKKNVKIT